MDSSRYAYSCCQDDSIIPNILPNDVYNGIVVRLRFYNKVEKAIEDTAAAVVLNSYSALFYLPCLASYKDDYMEFKMHLYLNKVNIPERVKSLVTDEVVCLTRSMLDDAESAGKKVIQIAVDVAVRTLQGPSESEQEAIARALSESLDAIGSEYEAEAEAEAEASVFKAAVNAAKSSIQAMEFVKVSNVCSDAKVCIICKKGLSDEMVVARLPCSHVYHGDCIVHCLLHGYSCLHCT